MHENRFGSEERKNCVHLPSLFRLVSVGRRRREDIDDGILFNLAKQIRQDTLESSMIHVDSLNSHRKDSFRYIYSISTSIQICVLNSFAGIHFQSTKTCLCSYTLSDALQINSSNHVLLLHLSFRSIFTLHSLRTFCSTKLRAAFQSTRIKIHYTSAANTPRCVACLKRICLF